MGLFHRRSWRRPLGREKIFPNKGLSSLSGLQILIALDPQTILSSQQQASTPKPSMSRIFNKLSSTSTLTTLEPLHLKRLPFSYKTPNNLSNQLSESSSKSTRTMTATSARRNLSNYSCIKQKKNSPPYIPPIKLKKKER